MKLSAALHRASFFVSLVSLSLVPLFFLPITGEFYEFNKQAVLIIAAFVNLLLWTGSFVADKQVRVTRSPLGLPMLAVLLAWLLSTWFRSPNRVEALLEPGQTTTIIALVILFFTTINNVKTKLQVELMLTAVLGSLGLLSLVSLVWSTGLLNQVGPNFTRSSLWTPAGSPIAGLTIIVAGMVMGAVLSLKEKFTTRKSWFYVSVAVVSLLAAGVISYRLFAQPATRPVFLSQSASWAIAMESLKSSPLWGTGPSTYFQNFSSFRPRNYNLTPNWSVRFTSASNYYLQILSTLGIAGLLAYVFVVSRTAAMFTKLLRAGSDSRLRLVSLVTLGVALLMFVAQLFVPTGLVSLALVFTLLTLSVAAVKVMGSSLVSEANIDITATSESGLRSPILPWIAFVLSVALVGLSSYPAARAYYAEILFRNSLNEAAKNNARGTYEQLISAFNANPFIDSYRVAYSQANLLIANSLAAKKDLTPEDRSTITQLVQQSIREAKNAVALNPRKVTNMENLAGVYRQLLNFAQGADAWTVAAYAQAIQLDPVNPNLQVALGGVYYSLKNYDEAIRLFQNAANLKPDLANAYYNLSSAYKEKGDMNRAFAAMQTVVNLVDKSSADYTKAANELEDLRKKAGEASAQRQTTTPASTNLERPQPLPSPRVNPPITLPQELGPDTTPSPSPVPTSVVTPTP